MSAFTTRDMSLIAYLDLHGFVYEMQRQEYSSEFLFSFHEPDVKKAVQDFYDDKGSFLAYANKLRNLKSRMKNTR